MNTTATYTRIDLAAAARHRLIAELDKHLDESRAKESTLRREIASAEAALRVGAEGIDLQKIALAELVLSVSGEFQLAGIDRAGVLRDAIAEIATGERQGYRGLWLEFFGTKDYAHWHGQRSDHEYGYGPKHGSVIFAIGLREPVRNRDPQVLTDAEKEACVYYLTNLERIQAIRQKEAA